MLWKQPQALHLVMGEPCPTGWTGLLCFIGSKTQVFRFGSGCFSWWHLRVDEIWLKKKQPHTQKSNNNK